MRNPAIWLAERILAYISGTRFFPKDLSRNIANKNFQYRINTAKFFIKFKKPYFGPFLAHFLNFWSKKSFSTKLSCYAQLLMGFWYRAKIQRNLMMQFQENNQTDVRRQRWTDPFYRILPAIAMGLTSKTTTVNWHLKVKYIEHNVGLTKSYCITVSMHKISSIHKFIQ